LKAPNITKKNHESQFLTNQILKDEIKKINNTKGFQRKKSNLKEKRGGGGEAYLD
jgi:hypothetical protein